MMPIASPFTPVVTASLTENTFRMPCELTKSFTASSSSSSSFRVWKILSWDVKVLTLIIAIAPFLPDLVGGYPVPCTNFHCTSSLMQGQQTPARFEPARRSGPRPARLNNVRSGPGITDLNIIHDRNRLKAIVSNKKYLFRPLARFVVPLEPGRVRQAARARQR